MHKLHEAQENGWSVDARFVLDFAAKRFCPAKID
jgi:hypothetical protein